MVVNEMPVYNSANLAMFMVNVSQALMRPMRAQWPELSVNDLKTGVFPSFRSDFQQGQV
jgi:hypothetical protein